MFTVKDPEIIKQITIKHFENFINHDQTFNEEFDKIASKNLFAMKDDKWKEMRSTLSPIFTSSKMKMMFELLLDSAQDFVKYFEEKIQDGKIIVDAKDVFARFTVDGIATSALGFKGNCLRDTDSYVYKIAKLTNSLSNVQKIKMLLLVISSSLFNLLRLQFTPREIYEFFRKTVLDAMNEREQKGIFRADVIQLLLQARKGQLQNKDKGVDEKELANFSANIEYDIGAKTKTAAHWNDDDFIAQGMIFFGAGFETTANLLQTMTYELAKNPKVQKELIDEVDTVTENLHGKSITYEALHKMKFMDMVVSESLRMWPPIILSNRMCNKDFAVDMGDGKIFTFIKNDIILLPIITIQNDRKYFDNPERFDPQRFNDDNKGSIVQGTFIPFGSGPRVCIGSRFALMEAKLLLFNVLSKFTLEICDKTPKKLEFSRKFADIGFAEKIFIELKPRKKNQ